MAITMAIATARAAAFLRLAPTGTETRHDRDRHLAARPAAGKFMDGGGIGMTQQSVLRGAAWMIVGAFGFSLVPLCVRQMSGNLSVFEIVFLRSALSVLILLPFQLRAGFATLRTAKLGLYGLRTVIIYAAVVIWFSALTLMPIADATALQFAQPLFTVMFAALILREMVGPHRWAATVIGFIGAALIIRPGMVEIGAGAPLALLSAALYAAGNIVVKILVRTEPASRVVFYFHLLLVPVALVPALLFWTTPSPTDWAWALGLALANTLGQIGLTRSFAAADASFVMPFTFLTLPFVAFQALAVYGEFPDLWTWVGAAVIFISGYYISRREALRAAQAAAATATAATAEDKAR